MHLPAVTCTGSVSRALVITALARCSTDEAAVRCSQAGVPTGFGLQGYLFRAAFLRRIPLFTRNLLENVLLCLVASGIESSARRWLTSIELEWRDALTARIHKNYFLNMVGSFQHFPATGTGFDCEVILHMVGSGYSLTNIGP